MPRPLARLDGDSTTFASGLVRQKAPRTPSPNAVSAVPSGRGLAGGSRVVTPRAPGSPARGAGVDDPHAARPSAAAEMSALPASPPGQTPGKTPIIGPGVKGWPPSCVG